MITFDQALDSVADLANPLAAESVPLGEADGRVLAAPVIARGSAPATTVSAMDGYAVRDADLVDGGPLQVIGESFAGAGFEGALAPGTCVRIFTGAPAPAGTDRVVIQEKVARHGAVARLMEPACARPHLRAAGSDFRAGEVLVPAGAVLDPQRLVAAAAADEGRVDVVRRPAVVILATGDELREPGGAGRADAIPESVSFGVAALARRWGAEVAGRWRLGDEKGRLERAAGLALESADVVVVTGGASVGEKDYAQAMFAPADLELVFSKVAIKPGKPVWLGRAQERLVVGLPGNPTAAMVTARLFLAPLIAGLAGRGAATASAWREARLAAPLEACGEREAFVRARWANGGVLPIVDQDSSAQKALARADLILRRRPGEGAAQAGDPVLALDF